MKLNWFFKTSLGAMMVASIVPMTIACSTSNTNQTSTKPSKKVETTTYFNYKTLAPNIYAIYDDNKDFITPAYADIPNSGDEYKGFIDINKVEAKVNSEHKTLTKFEKDLFAFITNVRESFAKTDLNRKFSLSDFIFYQVPKEKWKALGADPTVQNNYGDYRTHYITFSEQGKKSHPTYMKLFKLFKTEYQNMIAQNPKTVKDVTAFYNYLFKNNNNFVKQLIDVLGVKNLTFDNSDFKCKVNLNDVKFHIDDNGILYVNFSQEITYKNQKMPPLFDRFAFSLNIPFFDDHHNGVIPNITKETINMNDNNIVDTKYIYYTPNDYLIDKYYINTTPDLKNEKVKAFVDSLEKGDLTTTKYDQTVAAYYESPTPYHGDWEPQYNK